MDYMSRAILSYDYNNMNPNMSGVSNGKDWFLEQMTHLFQVNTLLMSAACTYLGFQGLYHLEGHWLLDQGKEIWTSAQWLLKAAA